MTDDEFFALSTRIEHSIITFRSLYPDEPPSDILRAHYADLTHLCAQLDAALGLPNADHTPQLQTALHIAPTSNLTFGTNTSALECCV